MIGSRQVSLTALYRNASLTLLCKKFYNEIHLLHPTPSNSMHPTRKPIRHPTRQLILKRLTMTPAYLSGALIITQSSYHYLCPVAGNLSVVVTRDEQESLEGVMVRVQMSMVRSNRLKPNEKEQASSARTERLSEKSLIQPLCLFSAESAPEQGTHQEKLR